MTLNYDIDARKLIDPVTGLGFRTSRLTYPDAYPVGVSLFRGAAPYSFTGNLIVTIRPLNGQLKGELARVAIPVEAASVASGVINLNTPPMNNWLPGFGDRPAVLEILVASDTVEVASLPVMVSVSRRFGSQSGVTPPSGNDPIEYYEG